MAEERAFIATPRTPLNMIDCPYSLEANSAYEKWREQKLNGYPEKIEDLLTEIRDPANLTKREIDSIRITVGLANFAFYQSSRTMDKAGLVCFAAQLGLNQIVANPAADDHGISTLRVHATDQNPRYIPYGNQPLNWHTDGYYNPDSAMIRAFILHCTSPADKGGENRILDHEIVYILLRDENPQFIRALMHPEAMRIPANVSEKEVIRKDTVGPVFSLGGRGHLNMRYTARTRSIQWKNEPVLDLARQRIAALLEKSDFIISHTLQADQGLICNNVLHARTGFTDSTNQTRLIYRARYNDRVETT